MSKTITNTDDNIDSRDVISEIEALQDQRADEEAAALEAGVDFIFSEQDQLDALMRLSEAASGTSDWIYGAHLIHESYFVEHIKELIHDCYEMPKNAGEWPYRHMTMDYEAAAEEAKQDYTEIEWDGETYYVR